MKPATLFAVLLTLASPLVAQPASANGAVVRLAPGVTLSFGDRDPRGYYWDGDRWREPGWWHRRYHHHHGWHHQAWQPPPPHRWHPEPPPEPHRRWHDGPPHHYPHP